MKRMQGVLALVLVMIAVSLGSSAEEIVTEPILTFPGNPGYILLTVAFSPDGGRLLTGAGPADNHTPRIWDANTGVCLVELSGHQSDVRSVAFSPDGTKVLTGSYDGTARLWDASNGSSIRTFSGHTSLVYAVAFSPNGSQILTGGADNTARLWNTSGGHIRTFIGHTESVASLTFSPDGTTILTGSGDTTARLWDAATGAHIRTFTGHTLSVQSVAFSPDGSKVLTGSWDGTARLWDVNTGLNIRTFTGHTDGIQCAVFSPDGARILTGGNDAARLCKTDTGEYSHIIKPDTHWVTCVKFSPDGTKIATGSSGGTARLWNIRPRLSVRSTPISGVFITGTESGETEYQFIVDYGQEITLVAPIVAFSNGVRYDFVRWMIDGIEQPEGEETLQVALETGHTVTAVYEQGAVYAGPIWYVKSGSVGDGSLEYPFGTIQQAIDAAQNGDTIKVAAGAYYENLVIDGKSLFLLGGWNADFSQRNREQFITIIDGNQAGSCVRWMDAESGELSGFTVRNGLADGAGQLNQEGGGIYLENANISISNNIIVANTATQGGGIAIHYGAPIIERNIISGNSAESLGGGIRTVEGSPTITHNIIDGNTASGDGARGGGIYGYSGIPTIISNTITENSASYSGGGISIHSSVPMINDNAITGNISRWGGGIYSLGGISTITNNIINSNIADQSGGGIYSSTGTATILNNIINDNMAHGTYGGGGIRSYIGTPTIVNNTIVNNMASRRGGGVSVVYSTSIVTNSILWGNRAPTGTEAYVVGSSSRPAQLTVSYTNMEGGKISIYIGDYASLDWALGNIDADPLFADPENDNFYLKSEHGRWDPAANDGEGGCVYDDVTSPCIDAGDPDSDYSNEPPPHGGRINMGAFGNTPYASKSASRFITVESEPFDGISITGTKSGETPYSMLCDFNESITLEAPQQVTEDGLRYNFAHWLRDGSFFSSDNLISLQIDLEYTFTAVYQIQVHTLAVESSPITGVPITGTKPGETNYTAVCDDQASITLNATEIVQQGSLRYDFVKWVVGEEELRCRGAATGHLSSADRSTMGESRWMGTRSRQALDVRIQRERYH